MGCTQQVTVLTCLERKKEIYRTDNRDPFKEELKIPPPHPHKRKNINYFPLEGSIFSLHHVWVIQNERVFFKDYYNGVFIIK
jgi:hypothetical protein